MIYIQPERKKTKTKTKIIYKDRNPKLNAYSKSTISHLIFATITFPHMSLKASFHSLVITENFLNNRALR